MHSQIVVSRTAYHQTGEHCGTVISMSNYKESTRRTTIILFQTSLCNWEVQPFCTAKFAIWRKEQSPTLRWVHLYFLSYHQNVSFERNRFLSIDGLGPFSGSEKWRKKRFFSTWILSNEINRTAHCSLWKKKRLMWCGKSRFSIKTILRPKKKHGVNNDPRHISGA